MQQGSWQTRKGEVMSRLVRVRRQVQGNNQKQEALTNRASLCFHVFQKKASFQQSAVISLLI